MKDFTWGTFISCMFLSFAIGFITCHKLYNGLDRKDHVNHDFIRRIDSSLSRK